MSDIPTEAEMLEAARRLGIERPDALERNKLYAAVQLAKREAAAEADPSNRTTAETIAAFCKDLLDSGFDVARSGEVLAELLRHLLRTEGLKLSTDTKEPRS